MDIRIKSSLYKEKELLQTLLEGLDEQYLALVSNDRDHVLICSIADKIDSIAKDIAITEIERRRIISNEDLIEEIRVLDTEELNELLKELAHLKRLIEKQNETNNVFVKQNLFFTRKMLKMIAPGEKFDTYNNSGKLGSNK